MKAAAGVPALRFNPGKPSREEQQATAGNQPIGLLIEAERQ
jgi:hypothetical protein